MLLAEGPSPPVQLHHLLLAWQFGDVYAVIALGIQVAAAAWYLGAARRLRRRGAHWSAWRTVPFMAGLATLTVALVSGLASYDDSVFVVHVIQHVMLMMVAPPLLAFGAPVTLAMQAAHRPMQTRIARLLHGRVVRALTLPILAAPLYYVAMYVVFLTALYPYSLQHDLVHNAEHIGMFAVGCLFWWPMVATDQLPHRLSFATRIFTLFVGMPFEVFLGVAIMNYSRPIAPQHTLADTHAGGAVFWVASMGMTFGAAMVLFARWMQQEERRASREDRLGGGASRRNELWEAARAAKMGTSSRRGG